MTIAPGFHLFPFRTEKLSPVTPMVLRNSGRVGSRRFFSRAPAVVTDCGGFFYVFLPAVPFFLPRNASRDSPAPCTQAFCRNLVACAFYLTPCSSRLLSYGLCVPAAVYVPAGGFSMRGNVSPEADCYPLSKWITCGFLSRKLTAGGTRKLAA